MRAATKPPQERPLPEQLERAEIQRVQAVTARDNAIAILFTSFGELVSCCKPLVEQAVREKEALQAAREASMPQSIKDALKRAHTAKKGAS